MPPVTPSSLHHIDLADGRFAGTTAKELEDAVAAWRASAAKDHVVIHFHGGLVGRKAGFEVMSRLEPTYAGAGAWPLFVVWRSDLVTTVVKNLDEIAKERVFQRLLRKLAQVLVGKLAEAVGARGGALELPSMRDVPADPEALATYLESEEPDRPLADEAAAMSTLQLDQIEKELREDPVIAGESLRIANWTLTDTERAAMSASRGGGPVDVTPTRMSKHVLDELRAEAPEPDARGASTVLAIARYGVKIAVAVLKRMRAGRGHGLYTTLVEEIVRSLYLDQAGALVWGMMKKDTADAFGPDAAVHGGTALVEALAPHLEAGARITLVGHSTGAIYIAHFLDALHARVGPNVKADVVFLAPACTFAFLHAHLPVLEARVQSFRMFALADEIESSYWEVPVLYRGSLLYLVSGLFEDEVDAPIVGMQRYYDAADGPYARDEVRRVSAWIGAEDRVWSVAAAGPGKSSSSKKHGDFDDDEVTKTSLGHLLANGFG